MRGEINTPRPRGQSPLDAILKPFRDLAQPRLSIREISEACAESLRRSRQRRGLGS